MVAVKCLFSRRFPIEEVSASGFPFGPFYSFDGFEREVEAYAKEEAECLDEENTVESSSCPGDLWVQVQLDISCILRISEEFVIFHALVHTFLFLKDVRIVFVFVFVVDGVLQFGSLLLC